MDVLMQFLVSGCYRDHSGRGRHARDSEISVLVSGNPFDTAWDGAETETVMDEPVTDWIPEPRETPAELTPEYGHADFIPTVVSQMAGYSLMDRLDGATKELLLQMAKEVR